MDSARAKQIIQSKDTVQVLFRGEPVWLENISESNVAEVTRLDNKERLDVPVYLLIEDQPLNRH